MADTTIIMLGMLQQIPVGGGGDPCLGCDPYGPVNPPQYDNCRTEGNPPVNYYDQLYHNGCCDTLWVTKTGACP